MAILNVAPVIADTEKTLAKSYSMNVQQAAATYDIATATGGDIYIKSAKVYVGTAVITLTSVSIQTNMTTAVVIMSAVEGAVANLTGDKNITIAFATPFILPSTKKLQFTIVGVTSGQGTMKLIVEYMRCAAGADLV